MKLYYYDLETYPNCFLFAGKFEGERDYQIFEISDRFNEKDSLLSWLNYLQNLGDVYMVGFNNVGFDYNILHELLTNQFLFDAAKAHQLGSKIISAQRMGFGDNIRPNDRIIPQIDLFLINHFNNKMKSTSLKALQFAMRSESVEDLPFDIRPLTYAEVDELRSYNIHDLFETEKFGRKCKKLIEIRRELIDTGVIRGDVFNYSDVRIGTEYLVNKIGRAKCYNGSKPKQSFRTEIHLNQIILPKIFYRTEWFNEVLDWFKSQIIYIEAEERPKLQAKLAGLEFHFGVGGVHASVENRKYVTNETHVIKDIDVSGMYVAVAIANGFYPEHLGQDFVTAYKQLQSDRKQYPKGTTMNFVLKLAGNGVFGNSNNQYSPFYDPKYTFSVTINGQLQLLQLAEALSLIPGLEIIQANTDGITALVPRELTHLFDFWCRDWERETGLKLEEAEYEKMWIRDVNNYLAVDTKGNVKRKGAYWYPITEDDMWGSSGSNWNKDFSNLAVIKGIELVLTQGVVPAEALAVISNPFDFMLRYKTPAGATVYIGDKPMHKTVRYYVSKNGQPMKKISQPKGEIGTFKRRNGISDREYQRILSEIPAGAWDARIHTKNKSRYEQVETSIESGYLVKECNNIKDFNWEDVDFSYYESEINKLVIGENK